MKYTKISILLKEKPPYFIGSQIRGAFGHALKKVVCINPSFKCEECFAKDNCLYFDFYENKNTFHKYRLDYKLGLDYYDFSLYLFDDAVSKLPYVVSSFYELLTKIGLGVERKIFSEFDMYVNDESIMQNNNIKLPKNYEKEFQIDNFCQDVVLKFVTPLRIKKENKFIRIEELELKDVINSIYQRSLKLQNKGFSKLPFEIKGEIIKKDLHFKKLKRFSNRQKTKMNLDGIVGEIEIQNLSKEEYEILKLGEIIGVGKQTTFGLGKIEVKDRDEKK